MEITTIELHPVLTPRRNGSTNYHVIVLIETDTTITGLGEFSDLSHAPAMMPDVDDLASVLNERFSGVDPTNLTLIEEQLAQDFPAVGKSKLVKAGIEIACHDITAKLHGIAVSDLLGGRKRDRIPVCYPIFRMHDVEAVPDRLEQVKIARDHGFDTIRFYFGGDLDAEERFLEQFADRFGDEMQIKSLDASGNFSWKEAIAAYERLKHFEFIHLESPVPRADLEGLARVTHRIDHPVSEHIGSLDYALAVIEKQAVDIMNVSLANIGGIRSMRRLHGLAASQGIDCLVGTTQELSIGTAAQAQTAAAAECAIHHSDPVGPFLYTADVVAERVQYEEGELIVPDGPGLGVEIDEARLAAHRSSLSAQST